MTIKRYEGATREEAIALAKQELGDEVVIMNVKEKRQSGVLGMFRKSMVEVTAAIEDDSSTTTFLERTQAPGRSPQQDLQIDPERENRFRERQSLLNGGDQEPFGRQSMAESMAQTARPSGMRAPIQPASAEKGRTPVPAPRPVEGRRFDASANESIPLAPVGGEEVLPDTSEEDLKGVFTEISEVLNNAKNPLPQASTYDRHASLVKYNDPLAMTDYSKGKTRRLPDGVRESFRSTAAPPQNKSALEALSKTKVMPDINERRDPRQVSVIKKNTSTLPKVEPAQPQSAASRQKSNANQSGVLRILYNTLLNNEVDERYVNEILNDIENFTSYDENLDILISSVYQKMVLKLGRPRIITLHENRPMVAFFIGPTGVGKTTTIAKLASQFKLNHKKNVALLSADTYRIAAEQQLSVYADRLSLPLDIMFPGEDINEKLSQFKKYDLIFVDTAGFSHNNDAQREDMKRMLSNVAKNQLKEIYLVLSATTKYRDLKDIIDTYKDITAFNIVFTKLDETASYGNLLNIRMYADAPLSYVTDGQNVPNDIEILDAQKLVKQLLEVQ